MERTVICYNCKSVLTGTFDTCIHCGKTLDVTFNNEYEVSNDKKRDRAKEED